MLGINDNAVRTKKISANRQAKLQRRAYHKQIRRSARSKGHDLGSWTWGCIRERHGYMLERKNGVLNSPHESIRYISFRSYLRWRAMYADAVRTQRELTLKGRNRPIGGDVRFNPE